DVLSPDPRAIVENTDKHLEQYPIEEDLFFEQTKMPQDRIESWNLLLDAQIYHSHYKNLATTIDGMKKRNEEFLKVLETYKRLQSQTTLRHHNDMIEEYDPLLQYYQQQSKRDPSLLLDTDKRRIRELNQLKDDTVLMKPNLETYHLLLKAAAYHCNPDICTDVLREMGNDGYNPSQQSYCYLAQAYTRKGLPKDAHNILNYLKATTPHHRVDVEMYNSVIEGYIKKKEARNALKLFDQMMQIDGEHPNSNTYSIMMGYYKLVNFIFIFYFFF
ncbi:hypothetical protein RFI_11044, partial [Reticulomyxa filosa]